MLRFIFTLGVITAVCLIGYSLSYYKAMDFFAIVLAMMSGVMLGFGFADGRRDRLILEALVAMIFCGLLLLAMWKFLWLIAAGYLAQAIWVLLHYTSAPGARVPKKYLLLMSLFNAAIAGFLFLRYV